MIPGPSVSIGHPYFLAPKALALLFLKNRLDMMLIQKVGQGQMSPKLLTKSSQENYDGPGERPSQNEFIGLYF